MLHGAAHWKATIHIYKQKSFKIPKIECIHIGLPKTAKSHFGRLGPLGVKIGMTSNLCACSFGQQLTKYPS
jgi:hypothetical protein